MGKMTGSNLTRAITVSGSERNLIIEKCKEMVSAWGLKLPDVEPAVLHFGLDGFYSVGEIEFDIVNDVENCYCGKFIFLFKGQKCPEHYHRFKKETFFIVKGKVNMTVNGEGRTLVQGDFLNMERGQKHTFIALEDALILESSNPDLPHDSIFTDPKINKKIFGEILDKNNTLNEDMLNEALKQESRCADFGPLKV